MGRDQPLGDLNAKGDGSVDSHGPATLDDSRQILGQELKRNEMPAVILADLKDLHHIAAVDGGRQDASRRRRSR